MATIGELLDTLQKLKTKQEAMQLLKSLSSQNPNAWSNIKYITGYLGTEERTRILNLFN